MFNVWVQRLAFTVHRSPFAVHRSPFAGAAKDGAFVLGGYEIKKNLDFRPPCQVRQTVNGER
jgi:hypothetical protein